jgi:hypothetical protein
MCDGPEWDGLNGYWCREVSTGRECVDKEKGIVGLMKNIIARQLRLPVEKEGTEGKRGTPWWSLRERTL